MYHYCVRIIVYQSSISLEFVDTLEGLGQHLLVDSTQRGHVLLAADVAAHPTRCTHTQTDTDTATV